MSLLVKREALDVRRNADRVTACAPPKEAS